MSARQQLAQAVTLYESFREKRPRKLAHVKFKLPKVVANMGYVEYIGYRTLHGKKTTLYEHPFAIGSRPILAVSSDGRQLMLLGGLYKFTDRGIVDRDAKGRERPDPKHGRTLNKRRRNPARPQSKAEHQEELSYILDVLKNFAKYSGSFNDDWQTFARYADMQSGAATRDGYGDIADVMKAAANRARRKRRTNPLPADVPHERRQPDPFIAGKRDAEEGRGYRPRESYDRSRKAEYRMGYEAGTRIA